MGLKSHLAAKHLGYAWGHPTTVIKSDTLPLAAFAGYLVFVWEREREKDTICKKNLISDVAKDARVSSLPFQFVTYNRDPIRDCQCRGKLHPCKQTQLFKNIYVLPLLPFSFPLSFVSFPESRSRPRGITYLVAIAAAAYDAHAHPILPSFLPWTTPDDQPRWSRCH